MSKMVLKLIRMFLILAGLYGIFYASRLIGSIFFPNWGALPIALPEDAFAAFFFTFLRDLLLSFPAIFLSSVVLNFAFWLKGNELIPERPKMQPALASLSRYSSIAIATTMFFAASTLFFIPWLENQLDSFAYRANLTQKLEDAYLKLKASGEDPSLHSEKEILEARLSLVQRLSSLRPQQRQYSGKERLEYEFEIQILSSHLLLADFFQPRILAEDSDAPDTKGMTIPEILALGDKLANQENTLIQSDAYTINHLAAQVFLRIVNSPEGQTTSSSAWLGRAKDLIDLSWKRIYELTISTDERLKASYFFRKGKSLGDFQFQNFLEAYYGFRELHHENPADEEVSRYLDLSTKKIQDKVLFNQDLEVLFFAPGMNNLVFRNPSPESMSRNEEEIIKIGTLLDTSQGVYLKGFELIRIDKTGRTTLHWKAPYARWGSKGLDFRVWDKDKPIPSFPQVIVESDTDRFLTEANGDPTFFQPAVTMRDLQILYSTKTLPQTLGTWELMSEGKAIELLGATPAPLQTEFFVRIFSPFGFFALLLVTYALALRFRNEGEKHPPLWQITVPFVPPLVELILEAVVWTGKLSVGSLLSSIGFWATSGFAAIVFLGLSTVGLVWSWNWLRKAVI